MRYKTVELIEEAIPWQPKEFDEDEQDRMVSVRIGYDEMELRKQAKEAGAIWDAKRKVWRMMYSQALALGLIQRVTND